MDKDTIIKKICKQKTLYHLADREFFVKKIAQNDRYILHNVKYMI